MVIGGPQELAPVEKDIILSNILYHLDSKDPDTGMMLQDHEVDLKKTFPKVVYQAKLDYLRIGGGPCTLDHFENGIRVICTRYVSPRHPSSQDVIFFIGENKLRCVYSWLLYGNLLQYKDPICERILKEDEFFFHERRQYF